ncbi:MAG: universal stress protein [Candidatus Nanopelagicales bacterium]
MQSNKKILVAYDASEDARAALEWAIAEAKLLGEELDLIFVEHEMPAMDSAMATLSWSPAVARQLAHPGEAITADGVERAAAAGVAATATIASGTPAGVLAAASAQARMLVMGSRGVNSLEGTILGSTSQHVAAHAHCPVVVVLPGQAGAGSAARVVVGVDGSSESMETLDWAAQFASRHARPLHVMYAYELPIYPEVVPYVPPAEVIAEVMQAADESVASEVAGLTSKYPDLQVSTQAVQERAAWALSEASKSAFLVVVGSHGRGGFTGMLLGSTSHSLLHHSKCSVAVIRHEKRRGA